VTQVQADRIAKEYARRGMVHHTAALEVTERELLRVYRSAAAELARRIDEIDDVSASSFLRKASQQVDEQIIRLTQRTQAIVARNLNRSVSQGLRDGEATLYATATSAVGRAAAVKTLGTPMGFDRLWSEAVQSLYGGTPGIELSPRIWEVERTTLKSIQRYLAQSMASARSRSEIVSHIRSFLLMPNVDMRTKAWRSFFEQNPPGRGVYRSAYKNVQRVLRTESNRAYRTATQLYARQKSWATGVRWTLSAAHPKVDICDTLAAQDLYGMGAGVYPAGEAPDSGHPHCLCYLVVVYNLQALGLGGAEAA